MAEPGRNRRFPFQNLRDAPFGGSKPITAGAAVTCRDSSPRAAFLLKGWSLRVGFSGLAAS
jgi:hypothetical protein